MLIDIEKVKEIVKQLEITNGDNSDYCFGWNECVECVLGKLNELAYGKTYKCLNCGKDIQFVEKTDCKYYMHTNSGRIRCDGKNSLNWAYDEIAIPTHESIEEQKTEPISHCIFCGKQIAQDSGGWYHSFNGTRQCSLNGTFIPKATPI